ncbi:SPOR domain-containing protein [Acidobacteriota bacterium]
MESNLKGIIIQRLFFFIFFCFFLVIPAKSNEKKKRVLIQTISPATIETLPRNTLTVAIQVTNLDTRQHEFVVKTERSSDWRQLTNNFSFRLHSKEKTIRLVSLFIPLRTLSGTYPVTFVAEAKDDSSITDRLSIDVKVILKTIFKIKALQSPTRVIGGEKYESHFLLTNDSNGSNIVDLEIVSGEGYDYHCDANRLKLEPGESRILKITVQTEPNIRNNLKHRLRLIARTKDFKQTPIYASASTLVEVIPRESGKKDYYQRIPLDLKFIGFYQRDSNSVGQLEFSGTGSIENKGIKKLDFVIRGPSRTELTRLGFFREEYRLSLESSRISINLGDHVYNLSKLSEYGHYGRGVEGKINFFNNFTLKAYYQETLIIDPKRKQKAVQLSYNLGKYGQFALNYLTNKKANLPEDQIYSLQTRFFSKPFNLNVEYARGRRERDKDIKIDDALWLEAFGDLKEKFNYQLSTIRAGADYPGSYSDLIFNSGRVSLSPFKNLRLRASYYDSKRNRLLDPSYSATYNKFILYGLQFRFLKAVNFFIDHRTLERRSLFPDPLFDYEDVTLRIGLSPRFGSLYFRGSVDIGETHNRLINRSSDLVEYVLSGSFRPFRGFSLGGHFQLRDQEKDFTGDKERRTNASFNLRLSLGRTNLYAFYRSSWYHEFYERILFDQSLVEKLLFNHLNVLEISIAHRLSIGHSIAMRVRHTSSKNGHLEPSEDLIGLIEYSIPFGFPVSRKAGLGRLRGRIYNVEKEKKGVPDVIVRMNGRSTVTNKKGQFVFHGCKLGRQYLDIDEVSLGPNRVILPETPMSVMVEKGRGKEIEIGVVKSAIISGKVMMYRWKDKDTKKSIPTPEVKQKRELEEHQGLGNILLELKNGSEIHHKFSKENGHFEFERLAPSKYTLRIYANNLPEFHYLEKDIFTYEVAPGELKEILIKVLPQSRKIKIIKKGTVNVKNKMENAEKKETQRPDNSPKRLSTNKSSKDSRYAVQIASFVFWKNANAIKKKLEKKYTDIFVMNAKVSGKTFYRVRIKVKDLESAQMIAKELQQNGYKPLLIKTK